MNKSGILGETFEQLGQIAKQTVKQVVKTPLEIAKGAAEQVGVKPQTVSSIEANLSKLKTKEEEGKTKNLAVTRQNLAQMMASPKKPEPRPAEKVEMERQQELQEIQKRATQQPPPFPIQKGRGTKEKLVGVSG